METATSQRPVGKLHRPTWRLSLGIGGLTFFVALALALRLRALFLRLDSSVTVSDDALAWVLRLLLAGAVVAPLLHIALHRVAAVATNSSDRRGYGRVLLAPLALDLLALPLLAIRATSPYASVLIAVNTALLATDLLVYLWLLRFPATSRVVVAKDQIEVYASQS